MLAQFVENVLENPWRKTEVAFFLFVFAVVFTIRGPFRALTDPGINDLLSPYIQASAWLHGADPYSSESLLRFWPKEAERARPAPEQMRDGSVLVRHGIPTAYPLTCFTLLAPFTVIPWPIFKIIWVAMSVGLFFASILSLVSLASLNMPQRVIFASASLLLAPFHSGIATCNIAIPATEVGVIGAWLAYENRLLPSYILIGVCIGLKPQIGLCFLAYYVVRRLWTTSAMALATAIAILAAGIFRLSFGHAHWLASYELDNRALLSSGVLGDFTERNGTRFGLVNLQVGLYPWLHDKQVTNLCALVFCLAVFALTLFLTRKLQVKNDLLCLSAISTLSLLPIYHRFYDASLLMVPLCWLVTTLKPRSLLRERFPSSGFSLSTSSAIGLLMIAAFFIPGGSLLEVLRDRGTIPRVLSGNASWNALVMAHSVWCLVVLVFVLLYHTTRVDAKPTNAVCPAIAEIGVPGIIRCH